MSLRSRFAIAFALVAMIVAVAVGALSYDAASDRITEQVDGVLRSATASLAAGETGLLGGTAPVDQGADGRRDPAQDQKMAGFAVAADGTVTALGGRRITIPLTDEAMALATAGTAGATDTTELADGRDAYRVRTTALGDGRGAIQVAIDVDDSERVLHGLAIEIALVSAAVLVVAAGAGRLLAWSITRRLVRLTDIAEEVSADGAIERAVPVDGRDEVGRLSASFNTMLSRLATARDAQDRLVQDAAHELRTPLTSLRTNASVLRRVEELSPGALARLIDDVQGETRELSHLVDELVELALSQRAEEPEEELELVDLARRAAQRVQRRTGRSVRIETDGSTVRGRRQALERAVGNLLENAAKFDEGSTPIEVTIAAGAITVTDHGPGIALADRERVFDRFYRADTARSRPGSGLGLAIVRDVAERHGGSVFVTAPPDGGAAVGFGVDAARLLPSAAPGRVGSAARSISVGDP